MDCSPESSTQNTYSEDRSFERSSITIPCTSFRVIPHALWQWAISLRNSAHPGLVVLPASFWKREMMDG